MIRSIFLLLIAMISIQYGASLAKQLFLVLGVLGTTSLRVLFSALILTFLSRPWRGSLKIKNAPTVALYGLCLGTMNLLFYLALEKIPLGVAVALEFLGPLGVSFYFSRKRSDIFWLVLATLGLFMLVPLRTTSLHSLNFQGVLFALGAGFFWGLYIIFGRRVSLVGPSLVMTTWGMWFAVLAVVPWGVYFQAKEILNFRIWPVALLVAILSSAIPYALEMQALRKIPPKTFGVLMSLEPAIATLIGFVFLSERLNLWQWSAIGMVAIASAGSASQKLDP